VIIVVIIAVALVSWSGSDYGRHSARGFLPSEEKLHYSKAPICTALPALCNAQYVQL